MPQSGLVFIALGWRYTAPANHQPYIPANTGTFGEFGLSGILHGAGVVFVFIGFDIVATIAQGTKNPQRNMPVGILGSLAVCTVLLVLFGHVLTGLANYTEFENSAAPVAIAIEKTPYAWLSSAVISAILVGYTSVILVDLLGAVAGVLLDVAGRAAAAGIFPLAPALQVRCCNRV